MKIVRDINQIKQLMRQKEEEDWGFRSFLKTCGIPGKKIDNIVHRLYEKISPMIDCATCSNCCKEIQPIVKETDVANMASGLKMRSDDFKKKYLVKANDTAGFTFNSNPCPFLVKNRCTVYNFRPDDCRSFPHLHKDDFTSRSISVIHNCSICPIVFNVYEKLKHKVWAMDVFDDSH